MLVAKKSNTHHPRRTLDWPTLAPFRMWINTTGLSLAMRTREDNNELCECLLAIDWPDWGGCPTILFSSGSISVETMGFIMGLCVDGWEYKWKMLYFPYFRLVSATFTKCWIRSNGHAYDIIILKYYTRYCSLVLCSDKPMSKYLFNLSIQTQQTEDDQHLISLASYLSF